MARTIRSRGGRGAMLSAPVNVVAPARAGTATLGQVQTVTNGTWTGNPVPVLTYRWIRDASTVIAGATGTSYTLAVADQTHTVKVEETATNSQGSASATSAPSATIP